MLNPELFKTMGNSAGKLSAFVLVCIILLLGVRYITAPTIAEEERQNLLNRFNDVLPASLYDNDPLQDQKLIKNERYLKLLGAKEPVVVYRARKGIEPAGAIFQTIAPNGYSGNIYILVGVLPDGQVSGVRVLKHAETPGLGDKIELEKNNWILSFDRRILTPGNQHDWAVRKDGGDFDQFTGATITPRAVVGAVKHALEMVNELGAKLYE
ncbi:electron transport complex subunit RsxG [Thiomicrorhabdus sp. HH1]|uniref:Ion-translocating oxidoreductase complex subunit G n=2 Tax=Piscirickettsiaceae TaxID=135616 RepID=A0ABS0BT41_9GAMM|nr:electron transport complex subunit RsxG [Thiomicrorhabdus heinhorstiae]